MKATGLLKRSLKSMALGVATRRRGSFWRSIDRALLGYMGIDFDPPKKTPIYPGGAKAAFVVSLDFDHLTKSLQPGSTRWFPREVPELLEKNRLGTKDMLEASEKYSIPMTWAICGKTAEEDPESYQSILRSKIKQEIGVHTYSHADVASISAEELEDEVRKCLKVLNLPEHPKTFIFPWNRSGHFDLLAEMGFSVYRDQKRLIGEPRTNSGLLNIPPTFYVDTKSYQAASLIKKYLDLCISWNAVFHLWMHPWSVVFDSTDNSGKFVKTTLEPVFSYASQKRREGLLATCTMGELASFCSRDSALANTVPKLS